MKFVTQIRQRALRLPYPLISLLMALAAFGTYTSMYAFRKAFTSATFEGLEFFSINYKVWLVMFQVAGYTLSKFYGIRFISAVQPERRGRSILILIGISWISLFFFALIPAPWNIVCLFTNGFPLGMIWGLVFGYLEGRRATEFMAAVMSVSLIFASGFIKTIGRTLMTSFNISEYWMPFTTGLLFAVPVLLFVGLLEVLPAPLAEDRKVRSERKPMNAADRQQFMRSFLPGIVLTLLIYVPLTVVRDIRDNFEVEIWKELGITSAGVYTAIDSTIAICVLLALSLLIFVRDNAKAFSLIHLMIIGGCLLTGLSTLLFDHQMIKPTHWMVLAGIGLYFGYIPYNAIFFERMLATFRTKGNVGFVMYIADAAGYLGSIAVLLIKELGDAGDLQWSQFFRQGLIIISALGSVGAITSLIYFIMKRQQQNANNTIQIMPV